MTKLVINADDFGYTEGVNLGIISAYKNGIVSSCTIMSNMPGFEHGLDLLKENPGLGCGVHMTLTCHKPLLMSHKTIVDENGYFHKRATKEVLDKMDLDEVYEEFCAQIDKVRDSGIDITHLDSHHHVHGLEELRPVIEKIVDKYKLPIRGAFEYNTKIKDIIPVIDSFYGDKVDCDYFEKSIEEIKKYEVCDLMCHPSFVDEFLLNSTSYAVQRTKEHTILTSNEVKEFLKINNITVVNYRKEEK
ncbi:MAG: chitin disaccharide deacetylase [Romboutsia sp.]|uniref:chitin disaccharide deacetylase n=1 Tax=Romboutsia sp. TaxID=1965302 RepID=UPI003F3A974F